MDVTRRQRIVAELSKLSSNEFEDLVAEVRNKEAVHEAGVRAFEELFAAKQRVSGLGRMGAYQATDDEQLED
jgi:predicted ATP-dependent Lon-type protease